MRIGSIYRKELCEKMGKHFKSNTSGNVAATFIGLLLAIVLVVAIDRILAWSMNLKVGKSDFFPKSHDVDGLGWSVRNQGKLKKTNTGYSLKHKEEFDGNVIFDVNYNFDEHYRREVPGSSEEPTDKFVIFFGGSQTFGEGLNDEDTIAALVQQQTPFHTVYNYGYKGYGPHQMLKKLETYSLASEIPETRGIAFFQYFNFHVPRAVGTMAYISWAGGGAPYYKVNNEGQLAYQGSFATGRFWKTWMYWLLGKSAIAKHYRVDLPKKLTHRHYDTFCHILKESRNLFHDQYPGSRFVVIVGMTNGEKDPVVEGCLKISDIEYVDLRGINEGLSDLAFPHNGHFTPRAAQLIAEQLIPLVDR